jgi:luciferase family oxidoreductase group 1
MEGEDEADQLIAMRVGILDQSPVRSGGTPADAVHETLELARAADRWGYHRYWLAEHHATPGLAGSCPEILIGAVAARTSRIRVGSGGVMLSHYPALKVAEQFRMLETLHPGRIDLGIGRAPGSDQRTARILRHGPGALGIEHYPRQIQDLVAADYQADELIVVTITHDFKARLRSYELLADVFELPGRNP